MFTHAIKTRRAFTLLEMLVVVSLLAATAFVATLSMQGVAEDTNDKLVLVEMQQIAKAIRQFKQDTGYYPKTGPFDLDTTAHGKVSIDDLPYDSTASDAQKKRWFYSPANLYQLYGYISPLDADNDPDTIGHQLEYWNPNTGRGWRGSYLSGRFEGYVNIGDDINAGDYPTGNANGDPAFGTEILDVPAIADPFEDRPDSGLLEWHAQALWRNSDESSGVNPPFAKQGRPYLIFGLDTNQPWIISLGPDGVLGEYPIGSGKNDDIELSIQGMPNP